MKLETERWTELTKSAYNISMIMPLDSLGPLDRTETVSTIELSTIPDFKTTLPSLSKLVPVLYRSFEHATQRAREFFESEGGKRDPYLLPALVRFYVKQFLSGEGIVAQELEVELESLANNGLSLIHAPFHVRILKADNGSVPTPGYSQKKQNFYNQQTAMYALSDGAIVETLLNLIVLWELDATDNLARLLLACPRAGGETRDSVELHWCEPIPHPATTAEARPATGEVIEDLAMSLRSPQKMNTGTRQE